MSIHDINHSSQRRSLKISTDSVARRQRRG